MGNCSDRKKPMPDEYKYKIGQCDVPPERRSALESYRAKRQVWLSWINDDEHHAIWSTLHSMVWTDVAFRTLTNFGADDDENALNNPLVVEALLNGHVATQVLAIRRLMDNGSSGIISLRRLVKDLKRDFALLTRENYICYDGLPYDYLAVRQARFERNAGKRGQRGIWVPTEGRERDGTSELAHGQFDKLSGIDPAKRSREDRLPISLITTIEKWLDDSGADDLAEWSHAYLAHAGDPKRRKNIADLTVTANKITKAIRVLARATEAISAWLLCAGGRSNALMPVAQFDPFEKLDKPIVQAGQQAAAYKLWRQLSDERNAYLDGVDGELIGKPKAGE